MIISFISTEENQGYAFFVVVYRGVGSVGVVTAEFAEESVVEDIFEYTKYVRDSIQPIYDDDALQSLENVMRAIRKASPTQIDHVNFVFHSGVDALTGGSLGAAAALAVWSLLKEVKTKGLLVTGHMGPRNFQPVGDIDEKALTAEKYGMTFLYPNGNTDLSIHIAESLKESGKIEDFETLAELKELAKVKNKKIRKFQF